MIRFFVTRHQAVFAFTAIIIVLGVVAWNSIPRESAPEIKQPKIFVNTIYPGVSAEDMEQLVTAKLEDEIEGLEGLKIIRSTSQQGLSSIFVEFTSSTDVEVALRRVRERVDIAKVKIPEEAEEPLVKELNFSDQPVLIALMSNPEGLEILEKTADIVEDAILRIPGVLDVKISGKLEHEVAVEVDPRKLDFFGLSLDDIFKIVGEENTSIPGGKFKNDAMDYTISVTGEIKDPTHFEDLLVTNKEKKIRLGEIAKVGFVYKDPETIARVNGEPAISFAITKRTGSNVIAMADSVKAWFAANASTFPGGSLLHFSYDESRNIRNMVQDLVNNILTGLVLVWGICWFFLGFRNGFFVGMVIPLTFLLSFFILQLAGITLNMVVLFSLVLALGMLVDNGIVIVENIYRHANEGADRINASIEGTREVAMPIIASTITTILAFFPIIFMPDIMGEFLSFLPKTVIIVLGSSLLVGLVINTTFCSRFLQIEKGGSDGIQSGGKRFRAFQEWYVNLLRRVVDKPVRVLSAAFLFVVLGFVTSAEFGKEAIFFPFLDPEVAVITLELPQGAPLDKTDSLLREIEAVAMRTPASLDNLQGTSGQVFNAMAFGPQGAVANRGNIRVGFVPFAEKTILGRQTIEYLKDSLKSVSGAILEVTEMEMGPPKGNDISYELVGHNYEAMGELAEKMKGILKGYRNLTHVDHDFEKGKPEVRVDIDRKKAALLGVNTRLIAQTVRNAMNGGIAGKYREGKEEYDIVVRYMDSFRRKLSDLNSIVVIHEGDRIPLGSVASVNFSDGPGKIKRKNLKRTVEVVADFKMGALHKEKTEAEIDSLFRALHVPEGVFLGFGEGKGVQKDATEFLMRAFLVALFLIALVLITQFNSFTQPFIIMVSVFLSIGGVFWGITLAGQTFIIIMTGIGLISLAGVVVNNAIVLMDYTNLLLARGMAMEEAVIEAGKTRLRPVLLTAITTVLGLFPMAVGVSFDFYSFSIQWESESAQWWGSMAWAIIYGLTFATVLTLIVVPVMLRLNYKWFGTAGALPVSE